MSTVTPAVPASEAPTMSEPARVANVFFSPGKVFADINRRPSWWLPWLILSIVTVAGMVVVDQKIGFEQITRTQIARSSRAEQFDKLTPEQQDQQIALATKFTKGFSYASPVFTIVIFAIVAGILMGTFNFGLGAEISFNKAMAIVAYGWMPKIISGILMIISLLVGVDTEGFNVQNPVATNIGYFINPVDHKFLAGALASVDVISFWILALMAIGFASCSKVKKSTAFVVILVWYLVFNLGAAAIGSM